MVCSTCGSPFADNDEDCLSCKMHKSLIREFERSRAFFRRYVPVGFRPRKIIESVFGLAGDPIEDDSQTDLFVDEYDDNDTVTYIVSSPSFSRKVKFKAVWSNRNDSFQLIARQLDRSYLVTDIPSHVVPKIKSLKEKNGVHEIVFKKRVKKKVWIK